EEIAPAGAQMGKERVLVFEQAVQTAIECVILREALIHTQQIGQRRGVKPVPVQTPFAAGREQAVEREHAQHFLPVRAFATAPQPRAEEGVQLKLAPELIAQPAGTPSAGPGELQLVQAHLHGQRIMGRRRAILGKERALTNLALLFIEDRDGLLPGGALRVVDLAQIENVSLHYAAANAPALDDGPGAMLLAVLLPHAALEKHATSVAAERAEGRGWVATTRRLG